MCRQVQHISNLRLVTVRSKAKWISSSLQIFPKFGSKTIFREIYATPRSRLSQFSCNSQESIILSQFLNKILSLIHNFLRTTSIQLFILVLNVISVDLFRYKDIGHYICQRTIQDLTVMILLFFPFFEFFPNIKQLSVFWINKVNIIN